MKQIVILFFIIIGMSGCEPKNESGRHEILRVENNLDIDIYYTIGDCDGSLPDYKFMGHAHNFLKRKSKVKDIERGGFENYFHSCPFFTLLFVDASLLKVPYDTIRKYDMVLYRRRYTLEQLDSLDWIVTIP